MSIFHRAGVVGAVCAALLFSGCATRKVVPYDYTAFRAARPASLVVLPPVSEAPDVNATPAVWTHATLPLAEAGYYVLPSTLVDATLRENGVQTPNDAQDIPVAKLREVFGADAAVYLRVKQYGNTYAVVASESRVTVEARIIDLRSGDLLWTGSATASSAEQQSNSGGGIVGLLVSAVVRQILNHATDASFRYAALADQRALGARRVNGVLPGPRAPLAWRDAVGK